MRFLSFSSGSLKVTVPALKSVAQMVVYPSRDVEPIHRFEFWDSPSSREWFKEHGYFLYEFRDEGDEKYKHAIPTREYPNEPQMSFQRIPQNPFPYAFTGPGDIRNSIFYKGFPPYSFTNEDNLGGRVMYAQDIEGRHVAVKMVEGGSEEYKVLRLLKDEPRLLDADAFPSVVPILDLLPYDNHWFLVMPRWEVSINQSSFFPTFELAFQHLISLLEGLVFLHDRRIFHRDLYPRNILVNHFSSLLIVHTQSCRYRQYLKRHGTLRHAIMDFDMAMLLDEETYGANPRRPVHEGLVGIGAAPYEVAHAYLYFDAFKYDVACLGIYFAYHYHDMIEDVPLLAPLISRMVTPNIDKRFTAFEALAFARTIIPTISSLGHTDKKVITRWSGYYYTLDVWAGLPESFVKEWNSDPYNVSSWSMRLKNWLFYHPRTLWGWYLMYYSRYTLHILTYVPRLILQSLRSLFTPLVRCVRFQ